MATKKGGLGKGLEALFAENAVEESGRAVTLPIADIEPNRGQPRKQFDDAALADLASSIAQHGVIQPLLVRPLPGGGYQLVAGEGRWRASRMAGLSEVPAVVREMSEQEAAELALIENLQRQDLNPMEEAMGYQTLMETYGLTQEEAAKAVGKSRPAIANALRLLHLPQEVAGLVAAGRLTAGHARAILAFEGEEEQRRSRENCRYGRWKRWRRPPKRRKKRRRLRPLSRKTPFTLRSSWLYPSRRAGGSRSRKKGTRVSSRLNFTAGRICRSWPIGWRHAENPTGRGRPLC